MSACPAVSVIWSSAAAEALWNMCTGSHLRKQMSLLALHSPLRVPRPLFSISYLAASVTASCFAAEAQWNVCTGSHLRKQMSHLALHSPLRVPRPLFSIFEAQAAQEGSFAAAADPVAVHAAVDIQPAPAMPPLTGPRWGYADVAQPTPRYQRCPCMMWLLDSVCA